MAGQRGLTRAAAVRPYCEADKAAVIALARELQASESAIYALMKPPEDIGAWYVDRVLAEAADHQGALIVAVADGVIVGYASLLAVVSSEDEADEIFHTYSYVSDLVVSRGARGSGIGRLLLNECERLARAAGQPRLRLNVLASNEGARLFYARLGFEPQLVTLEKPLA